MGIKRKNNPDYELVMGAGGRRYWAKKDRNITVGEVNAPDVDSVVKMVNDGGFSIPEYCLNDLDGCIVHEGELSSDGTYGVNPSLEIFDEGQFSQSVLDMMGVDSDRLSFEDMDEVVAALCGTWEPIIRMDSYGEYCDGFILGEKVIDHDISPVNDRFHDNDLDAMEIFSNTIHMMVSEHSEYMEPDHGYGYSYHDIPNMSVLDGCKADFTSMVINDCNKGIPELHTMSPHVRDSIVDYVSNNDEWDTYIGGGYDGDVFGFDLHMQWFDQDVKSALDEAYGKGNYPMRNGEDD